MNACCKQSAQSTTFLHSDDRGIARHILSNSAAHMDPEKARQAIRKSYSKAQEFEDPNRDSGHAVFGPGSAFRSADAFDHQPPEIEMIIREVLRVRVV
jgi:hypothetical protein